MALLMFSIIQGSLPSLCLLADKHPSFSCSYNLIHFLKLVFVLQGCNNLTGITIPRESHRMS